MRAAYEHIEPLVKQALQLEGDLIELGVWRGDTFMGIAEACRRHLRVCYAVDSWRGMAPPTDRDVESDGTCQYPEGGLATDYAKFEKRIASFGDTVRIVRGFIPDVLEEIGAGVRFAFAHVDLDQYAPTLCALRWIWPRVVPGGIVAVHDWFFGREILAAAAVVDWIVADNIRVAGGFARTRHIWFIKPDTPTLTKGRA